MTTALDPILAGVARCSSEPAAGRAPGGRCRRGGARARQDPPPLVPRHSVCALRGHRAGARHRATVPRALVCARPPTSNVSERLRSEGLGAFRYMKPHSGIRLETMSCSRTLSSSYHTELAIAACALRYAHRRFLSVETSSVSYYKNRWELSNTLTWTLPSMRASFDMRKRCLVSPAT